jgi:hypothetical protein
MRLRLARLLAATALVAAGGAVVTASPASAASCTTASGVTVVVDFHELGGGAQSVCDSGGAGKYAATLFGESGFSLARVQREQGFVCRVNNAPSPDQEACVNTPPTDAYWGLWWSNGTSGSWTYASSGVDSLKVPAGGSVAFSWNGSSTKSPPGTTPPAHASSPSPKPTPKPTAHPSPAGSSPGPTPGTTSGGTTGGTGTGSEAGGTAPAAGAAPSAAGSPGARTEKRRALKERRASARPEGKETRKAAKAKQAEAAGASASPSASATPSASASASADRAVVADPASADGDALPVWLAPAGIAVLFAAAGATALVRRRRGTSGP